MNDSTTTSTGCGGGACQCASKSGQAAAPDAYINGIALPESGQRPDTDELLALAYSELLRPHAVMNELLPRPP